MKNEYIEVVKRWQAGEVVSVEALKANADRAADAADDAYAAYRAGAAARAAARAAAAYAADAADAAGIYDAPAAADAACWVKRYEELTNDEID